MDARFTEMLTPYLPFLRPGEIITSESPLRELGLNSMQAIELIFALEDTFEATLSDEALTEDTFATAGSLWAAVEATIAGMAAST
jgi:acyl carrier protein